MKKLLVIVGPTATGKTDLALEIAKKFDGELVSADSRQVYQGMDIGTGKLSQTQNSKLKIQKFEGKWLVDQIPIHLYDIVKPDQNYSVAAFQQAAYQVIDEIQSRNKLPILVGGTGLYVQAVVEGLKIPKAAPDAKLRAKLEKKSTETLLDQLKEVDPLTYEKIDQANRRRLIRALEIFYTSGESMSVLKSKFKVGFDSLVIGLTTSREELYRRADRRIDKWFDNSEFQQETQELLKEYLPDLPAFTSLGYQDVIGYLSDRLNLEEARQRTKFKHHGFIRHQITWFRKMSQITWFDIESLDKEKLFATIAKWLA